MHASSTAGPKILSLQPWLESNPYWRSAVTPVTDLDPRWYERGVSARWWALRSLVRRHGFEVVVFHRQMTKLFALAGVARRAGLFGARLFLEDFFFDASASGTDHRLVRDLRRRLRFHLSRLIAQTADAVGVHTQWEVEHLPARLGVARNPFVFVPTWITLDAEFLAPPDVPDLTRDPYLLVAGTLRDYGCLLQALEGLPHPCVLVVHRWDLDEIDQARLPGNVELQVNIPYRDYAALLRNCRAVVVPLHRDRHLRSLGQTQLFEAMAARKPVVCADTFHLRDYTDASRVLYYQPEDPLDLREKIGRVWGDESLGRRLTEAAFAWVNREVRPETYIERLLAVIDSVCRGSTRK